MRIQKITFAAILVALVFQGCVVTHPGRDEVGSSPIAQAEHKMPMDPATKAHLVSSYGKLPLSFEANHGQTDGQVKYLSRGIGYTLYLAPAEAVLSLRKASGEPQSVAEMLPMELDSQQAMQYESDAVLRMQLVGANAAPSMSGMDKLPGKSNYFIGNDPDKWQTNVSQFSRVKYDKVYPGIDLVYYGNQRQLEYDFIVAPGADPESIRITFTGAERMEVDEEGDLILHVGDERVVQHKPVVYQQIDGKRQLVNGQYRLEQDQVGFEVAMYDTSRELIIDPVLVYATYLGGNALDSLRDMEVDSAGNAYLAGYTASTNFPVSGAYQASKNGSAFDSFVAKLNPSGDTLLYSTYIGGSNQEVSWGLEIDAAGSAYVSGVTKSFNYPTTPGSYQPAFAGFISDGFITKLSPDGASLVYSTYVGGSGSEDLVVGLAVDSAGSAYMAMRTVRNNNVPGQSFPVTPGAYRTTSSASWVWEPAVTKLSPDGSSLIYSTYLNNGGFASSSSQGHGIAITLDALGNAYVAGYYTTGGALTITPGAFQPTHHGGFWDVFVTKVSADGSSLLYSTFLGGSGDDLIGTNALTVDASGNLLVSGVTKSVNFPTVAPLQAAYGGGLSDAFITKLSPSGTSALFSTYLGGSGDEGIGGKVLGSAGWILAAGSSTSVDFPVTPDALYSTNQGSRDAVVIRLSADGQNLAFSTYLGGPLSDAVDAIGLDAVGNIYVAGGTTGQFPVTPGAFQTVYGGGSDGLIAKLQLGPSNQPPVADAGVAQTVECTSASSADVTLDGSVSSDPDGDPLSYAWSWPGGSATGVNPTASFPLGTTTVTLTVDDGNGGTATATTTVTVQDATAPTVNAGPDVTVEATGPSGAAYDVATQTIASDTCCTVSLNISPAGPYSIGSTTVTVTGTDCAGNIASDQMIVTVQDTTPPSVTASADINMLATGALTPVNLGTATATDAVDGAPTPTPSATGPFARGVHTIIWSATDTAGNTGTANQTVTVTNNPPVANADSTTTVEDTAAIIAVLANDTDVEGDALTVTTTIAPANGAVVVNPDNTVTYTPNANFNGSDSFSYSISDGNGGTASATVNVTITAVNDAPVAVNDAATTDEDVPVTITVLANDSDADGDALTVTATTLPANGSVVINGDNTVTYTPNTDFNGADTFTYTVDDGNGGTATATVNVTINPVNDAPTAKAASTAAVLPLGGTFLLDGTGSSDVDGDPIASYAWAVFSAPAGSTAAIAGAGTATPSFTPDKIGDYLIVLVVSDGTLVSAPDTLALAAAPNLPPVASLVAAPLTGLKPLPVNFNATASSDPEGGPLTFEWVFGDGATGTGPIVNHTYANAGIYTAELTVIDNMGNSDMASATITVTAPNLPPTVLPTATPSSGAPPLNVAFTAGASDPEGQPLSYSWSFGDGGTSTLADPVHSYIAAGTYTATVTVSDGVNLPVSSSLTISVGSALTINVTQAKFDFGKKGKHKGKVTFVAGFTYAGLPAAGDLITVSIDGEEIFSAPFGDFKEKKPGYYKIKLKKKKTKAQAFIDFNNSVLAVTRHKMDLSDIDNDNGVDVVISFGSATATDHLKMKEKIKHHVDEDDEKEMHHKEHH